MAKRRIVNTAFWDDSYIITLNPLQKLLFLYLLTNPLTNILGIYEISDRRISFDTGIKQSVVNEIFKKFETDEKVLRKGGFVAIANFVKHQELNPKVISGVERELELLPKEIRLCIDYDSLSHLTKLNLTQPNLTEPNSTKLIPLESGDFINELILIFSEEYKSVFGFDYIVTNNGKERSAAGKILNAYKSKNNKPSREQTLLDFRNLFKAICSADYGNDKFLAQIDLPKINSQLNKYLQFLHKDLKEKTKWERL